MSTLNTENYETPPTSSFEVLSQMDQSQHNNYEIPYEDLANPIYIKKLVREYRKIIEQNKRYCDSSQKLNKQLNESFKYMKEQAESRQAVEERERAKCEETKVKFEKKNVEINALKEEVGDLKAKNALAEEQITTFNHTISVLEEQLKECRQETKVKLDDKNKEINILNDDVRDLKIRNTSEQEHVAELKEIISLLKDQLKEHQLEEACAEGSKIHSLSGDLLGVKHTNNALEKQLEDERYVKEKLESYTNEITEKNKDLQKKVADLSRKLNLQMEENEKSSSEINTLEQQNKKLSVENSELSVKNNELCKICKQFEEERNGFKNRLKEQFQRYSNSEHPDLEVGSREASSIDLLNDIVLVEKTKNEKLEEKIQHLEREVARFEKENFMVRSNANSEMMQLKQDNQDLIVDIKKFEAQAEIRSNEVETLKTELCEMRKKELTSEEKIKRQLKSHESHIIEIYTEKIKILEDVEKRLENEKSILNTKYIELKSDNDDLREESKELKFELDILQSKYVALLENTYEYKTRNEALQKEVNSNRQAISDMQSHKLAIKMLREEHEQERKENSEVRDQRDMFEKKYMDAKEELDKLKEFARERTNPTGNTGSIRRSHGNTLRMSDREAAPPLPARPRTPEAFVCPICNQSFDNMRTLEEHANGCTDYFTDSTVTANEFFCPVCQSNQENFEQLQRHAMNCGDFSNI